MKWEQYEGVCWRATDGDVVARVIAHGALYVAEVYVPEPHGSGYSLTIGGPVASAEDAKRAATHVASRLVRGTLMPER